jgi:hypothetical protein
MRIDFEPGLAVMEEDVGGLHAKLMSHAHGTPRALHAGGPGAPAAAMAPKTDPAAMVEEILAEVRKGVNVKPFAESRSLLALLAAAKQEIPPELAVDAERQNYHFYWVEIGFDVMLDADQFAHSAELGVVIRDDGRAAPRKTRPIRLFPDRKDVTLFSADLTGGIGLDAHFDIVAPGGKAIPYAELAADASVKAKLVFGPLAFAFRRAAIEVTGTGEDQIYWRYRLKSELRGMNEFKSILVLKVPAEINHVALDVALKVVKCKRKWLLFSDMLPPATSTRTISVELDPKPSARSPT